MASGVVSSDVLAYCRKRLDLPVMDAIIKANRAGLDAPGLEDNLQNGTYIPVLSAVWGERDKAKRIDWLRLHADLHPPLMFERAIAEFVAAPTAETVTKLVVPLMHAAAFRIHQDAECLLESEPLGKFLEDRMYIVYLSLLAKVGKKHAPELNLEQIMMAEKDGIDENSCKRLARIASITLRCPELLPNPVWISYHHGGSKYPMHAKEDFKTIRQHVAREELLGEG